MNKKIFCCWQQCASGNAVRAAWQRTQAQGCNADGRIGDIGATSGASTARRIAKFGRLLGFRGVALPAGVADKRLCNTHALSVVAMAGLRSCACVRCWGMCNGHLASVLRNGGLHARYVLRDLPDA